MSDNVIDFCRDASALMAKVRKFGYLVCCVDEFIEIMNGTGYDDPAFEIYINPFINEHEEMCGWYLNFNNPEFDSECYVCNEKNASPDNFTMRVMELDDIIVILDKLTPCSREAVIKYETNNPT